MLPLRFDDIAPADILRLVVDKESERKVLEYKQNLPTGNQEETAEFLADISSFANASGGDVIFGISDQRDESGRPTGVPDKIVGISTDNAGAECARIEQRIESGIQPRLPIVFVRSIEIPERGTVILIRVGKSWLAPHMVSFANRTRFFSRNGTGKMQLDVQQIGAAFAQQRGLGERLRAWKTDRISKSIAGEGPVELKGARLLFHFIPATTLMDDSSPHPRVFDTAKWNSSGLLMSLSPDWWRYNADGMLLASKLITGKLQSYLQVFRDGALEYGDSYQLDNNRDGNIPSSLLEERIVSTFKQAIHLLKCLGVEDPVYTTLTLVGVKGRIMAIPYGSNRYGNESDPFDRDVILCPDIQIKNVSEGHPYPTTLLPIVNSVWQAVGLPRSLNIHSEKWVVGER